VSKWRPFSSIFNGENRKVGWVGDDGRVVFGEKFLGRKGRVRWCCVVMMQQRSLLSPKIWCEVFTNFNAVIVKHQNSMRNSLFGLPREILCEQSL
jgi:hypothetical protein